MAVIGYIVLVVVFALPTIAVLIPKNGKKSEPPTFGKSRAVPQEATKVDLPKSEVTVIKRNGQGPSGAIPFRRRLPNKDTVILAPSPEMRRWAIMTMGLPRDNDQRAA